MNSHQYFDQIASEWNTIRHQYFKDDIRPWVRTIVDFKEKKVVDLGAGTGFLTLDLALVAQEVIAVDQSAMMLKEIENKAQEAGLSNVKLMQTQIDKLDLEEQSVDVVIINMALHHMEEPALVIQEMYRILKPGGVAIVSDVIEHQGTWAHKEMHDVWLGFSLSQIDQWMNRADFSEVRVVNTQLRAIAKSSVGEIIDGRIFMGIGRKGESYEN